MENKEEFELLTNKLRMAQEGHTDKSLVINCLCNNLAVELTMACGGDPFLAAYEANKRMMQYFDGVIDHLNKNKNSPATQ